jgi:NAD(P)H-flavin reductase
LGVEEGSVSGSVDIANWWGQYVWLENRDDVDSQTVTVIGSDDNEGVIEFSNILEVLNSCSKGIIKLQEITERTVDILYVHFFVNELVSGQ